jgi:hypothetical protein
MNNEVCYVGLFAGSTPGDARMIAATAEPEAICAAAKAALKGLPSPSNPVLRKIVEGRREALREAMKTR